MFEAKHLNGEQAKAQSYKEDLNEMSQVVKDTLIHLAEQHGVHAWKCIEAYILKGGWESWFQVELTLALNVAMNNKFRTEAKVSVYREQPLYALSGTSQKSDILIRLVNLNDPSETRNLPIELKCQSRLQSGTGENGFITVVDADSTKVSLATLDEKVLPCRCLNILVHSTLTTAKYPGLAHFSTIKDLGPSNPINGQEVLGSVTLHFVAKYKDFIWKNESFKGTKITDF
jgi:hypothetical protein